jgi:hypothetical protein
MDHQGVTSIDDVQDNLDAMILALFEAMRGASAFEALNSEQAAQPFLRSYFKTVDSIDMLRGIDKTRDEILNEIALVQRTYAESKRNVLRLQNELIMEAHRIEEDLLQVGMLKI